MDWSSAVKFFLAIVAVSLIVYLAGPPLYWHAQSGEYNCPRCQCDCDFRPSLALPEELINASSTDCVKRDPDVSPDTEHDVSELLLEEVTLKETEALENQQRADMTLLEAKKLTSTYQKEADKCNSGMATCETAREKSEAALMEQKKLTETWETRARAKGWKEEAASKSRSRYRANAKSA